MRIVSLGKITATAGTPVQAVTASTMAHKVIVEPLVGNSGKAYVGTSALSVSTGAGLIKTFLPPAASGLNDDWTLGADNQSDSIDVSQFYFDVQTSGQGVTVSYVIG